MSPNEYQEKCLRTENKDVESIKLRLREPEIVQEMFDLLQRAVHLSKKIDGIKKFGYYGKPIAQDMIDSVLATIPGTDQANRASCELINDRNVRLLHAVLGMITESGELAEMMLGTLYDGKEYTDIDWAKEFGDVGWYQAVGVAAIPAQLEDAQELNIEKLAKRYPNLFTEKRAQNHDGH